MVNKIIISDLPAIPEMDIAFAISASTAQADRNYKVIRDTISSVIDQYGIVRTRYAVIVFGKTPTIKVRFTDDFASKGTLKNFVQIIPRTRGDPALAKTLEEAKLLFKQESRPNAKKILVVITDKKSDDSSEAIKNAAKMLEQKKVSVIAVPFGSDADPRQLETTTPDKRNVISANITADPKNLAKQVMDKAVKCEKKYMLLFYFRVISSVLNVFL